MARFKDEGLMTFVGDFLNVYLPLTRNASSNTVESYEEAINLFDKYLRETGGADGDKRAMRDGLRGCDMSCFNARNLYGFDGWLRDVRGNCSKTREQRMTAIVGLVDYATDLDISNASLLVQAQKVRSAIGTAKDPVRIVGHMTEAAWEAVIAQPDVTGRRTEHRNWVFMVLMYETAARKQEVLDLRVKDVVLDGEAPFVYIKGKGHRERLIPIRESCAAILRDYIARFHPREGKSDAPLFYTRHSGEKCRMSPDTPEKFLDRYGKSARKVYPGVPERVHPHLVRHTRAVHLLESGMTLEDLMRLLGHKDVSTTKIYVQSSAEVKRAPLARANGKDPSLPEEPGFWEGNEGIISRLERPSRRR